MIGKKRDEWIFLFWKTKIPNYEYVQTIGTLLNTYLAILFFFEEGRKYRREAPEIIERRDSSERRNVGFPTPRQADRTNKG